jgi:phage terminase large subunit
MDITVNMKPFKPRWYQEPIFDAIENKGYKKVLYIAPRRCGKDIASWNLLVREAIEKPGIYWYIFPEYGQGKRAIWDGRDNDGEPFLDFVPKELIRSQNSQELKIMLINNSIIQIVGSDNVDRLRGANPRGAIFSEFAEAEARSYPTLKPIFEGNNGWLLINSTPKGKNHLYDMFRIAQDNPDSWYHCILTVDDTKHISADAIKDLEESGEMSWDFIQQEFYCSFELGVEGAYYTRYLDAIRLNNQIGHVPWNPSRPVHTAWDIGVDDFTSIIWFQSIGATINIIDCYENKDYGVDHYAKIVLEKPYLYGTHIGPHDLRDREWGNKAIQRVTVAQELGIDFEVLDATSFANGIEQVRTKIPIMYIDEVKCKKLIKAIENYRKEYDHKRNVYSEKPRKSTFNHFADALRYLCVGYHKIQSGMTPEDLKKLRLKAMHGEEALVPSVFQQPRYY